MSGEVRDPALRRFFLLSGGGNNFVALLGREGRPSEEDIRRLCRRGLSLGTDGLVVVDPADPDDPGDSRVTMAYFNRDGREAPLCLNAARCTAELAFSQLWCRDLVTVSTFASELEAKRHPDHTVEVSVPVPADAPAESFFQVEGESIQGWTVDTGVPHLVVFWKGPVDEAPLEILGPNLRSHSLVGPEGTNVNLVQVAGSHEFFIRTYERGVEAETLACGTGVLAAVAAGLTAGLLELPVVALTAGGFGFQVAGTTRDGALLTWTQRGDARVLAQGEILAGALATPS